MVSKSKIIKALGPFGLYATIRWLMRNHPRIVMFHRFSPQPKKHCVSSAELEKQVIYLKKRFNIMPLSELRKFIEIGRPVPKNSIVLTVDDGYRDFYEVAYPIFKKYEVPATLYVTTGFVSEELWLWPDQISWLLNNSIDVNKTIKLAASNGPHSSVESSQLIRIERVTDLNRGEIWSRVVSYLLTVDDKAKHEWIAYFAKQLEKELPEKAPEQYAACSWSQLQEMQKGGIEIGGHTHTHPSLGQVTTEQLCRELTQCKQLLDEKLGEMDRDFCFPNGQPNDYNDEVKEATKRAAFKSSVTAFYDSEGLKDLFEMRRHTASEDWFQFCKSFNGVEAFMAKHLRSHNRV